MEKVAEIMDDINESMGIADELGEAMAQPIGPQLDEDELAQELEELESEVVDSDLLKAPVVPVKAKQQVPGMHATSNQSILTHIRCKQSHTHTHAHTQMRMNKLQHCQQHQRTSRQMIKKQESSKSWKP